MIISKPPTNSVTNVCSRIFLPRCLLGKKSGRYLAVTQVAAKVYRPIESLLFFVRAMRCIGWCPINTYGGHDSGANSVFHRHRDRQLEPSSDRSWGSFWYQREFSLVLYYHWSRSIPRDLHSDASWRKMENATRWFSDLCIVCELRKTIVRRL